MKISARFLVALSLLGGLPALAFEQSVSTGRYPLAPAGRLTVENVQGDILVEAWDRAQVELTSVKTALGADAHLDNVRIAVDSIPRGMAIRTTYLGESDAPVRVDYHLRVPRQVRLEGLRTVQGDIIVRGIEGSMDARSLNGNILGVDLTGRVTARAANGRIDVSLRSVPEGTAPLRLETLNGDVSLALPPKANLDLEVSTVAGKVDGSYFLAASGVPDDNTRRARVGRGGTLVRLRTVRGNIRLEERDDLL